MPRVIELLYDLNGFVQLRDGTIKQFHNKEGRTVYYAPDNIIKEVQQRWRYRIPTEDAYRLFGTEIQHLIKDYSGRPAREHRQESFDHDLKFSNFRWSFSGPLDE